MKLTQAQTNKVTIAIAAHERLSGSYFWKPPGGASSRRQMEKNESIALSFRSGGHLYAYTARVSCSCKNVYYSGEFTIDGERKTVRSFRRLI